jgi:hypothetical protein
MIILIDLFFCIFKKQTIEKKRKSDEFGYESSNSDLNLTYKFKAIRPLEENRSIIARNFFFLDPI